MEVGALNVTVTHDQTVPRALPPDIRKAYFLYRPSRVTGTEVTSVDQLC